MEFLVGIYSNKNKYYCCARMLQKIVHGHSLDDVVKFVGGRKKAVLPGKERIPAWAKFVAVIELDRLGGISTSSRMVYFERKENKRFSMIKDGNFFEFR